MILFFEPINIIFGYVRSNSGNIRMKRDYIPQRRSKIDSWEQNFIEQLTSYATRLGIDASQLSAIAGKVSVHREAYREAVEIKATAKGKVKRMQDEQLKTVRAIRKMVRLVKASPNYTESMGKSMGIIGPENETQLGRPVLKVVVDARVPVISFRKGSSKGMFIYSKRGNEQEFSLLAFVTRSPFTDRRPNLDPERPEERHYAAFFMLNDQPTGDMSAVTSVTLGRG